LKGGQASEKGWAQACPFFAFRGEVANLLSPETVVAVGFAGLIIGQSGIQHIA